MAVQSKNTGGKICAKNVFNTSFNKMPAFDSKGVFLEYYIGKSFTTLPYFPKNKIPVSL